MASWQKIKIKSGLSEKFVCNVHKRMYGYIWRCAGDFRLTHRNIGIDKYQIPIQPKNTVLWHLVLYKIIPKLREK